MASRTITVHLAKDGLQRYEDALKADREFTRVQPIGRHPANPVLFVKLQDAHPPRWAALISEGFDLSEVDLGVKSASAVMFLRAADRIFALAFGHGYAMLDEAAFVEDFGLKVALSTISPERLRNVDIVRPEAFALRKRQQTGRSSTLAEFEFDQLLDIIKTVTGRTETAEFATKLTGSNSLKLSSELSFDQIPRKCERALALYQSDAYQEHFGVIDHLRSIRDPVRVQELDRSLLECLVTGVTDQVVLSPPEIIDEANIAGFKYGGTRDRTVYSDLDIDTYLRAKQGNEINIGSLKNHKIQIVYETEGRPLDKWSVYKCIIFEVANDGQHCILAEGGWYVVGDEFRQRVEEAFQNRVRDVPLPPAAPQEWERAYCERVSRDHGWILFDRVRFAIPGPSSTPRFE